MTLVKILGIINMKRTNKPDCSDCGRIIKKRIIWKKSRPYCSPECAGKGYKNSRHLRNKRKRADV
jgi:ribosomal protein L37AE/L43A